MPFIAPPSTWMQGEEAIRHIQNAERRTKADAIKQLKDAISHRAVYVRLINAPRTTPNFYDHTGPGSTPMMSPGKQPWQPTPESWADADVAANGTRSRIQFEVLRSQVLQRWPIAAEEASRGAAGHDTKVRKGPKPGALRRFDAATVPSSPRSRSL